MIGSCGTLLRVTLALSASPYRLVALALRALHDFLNWTALGHLEAETRWEGCLGCRALASGPLVASFR